MFGDNQIHCLQGSASTVFGVNDYSVGYIKSQPLFQKQSGSI